MKQFAVTFERWTPSALEAGETNDRGFVCQGVSLGDAVRLGLEAHHPEWLDQPEPSSTDLDGTRWYTWHEFNNGTHEYYTKGIIEERSLHIPDHVTTASRRRIARLFGVRYRS